MPIICLGQEKQIETLDLCTVEGGLMSTEYKVICDTFCLTSQAKARKVEDHLNSLSPEGWAFVALDPVLVLGIDVGFYLVVKKEQQEN
jgi:hypothetical protein